MKNLFSSLFVSRSDSKNQSASKLRLEALESRQMLSATPIETAAVEETDDVAIVAPMATASDDVIDISFNQGEGDEGEGDEQVENITINLADADFRGYSTFKLDVDGLYGKTKDEYVLVFAFEVAKGSSVVINGQANVAETLEVEKGALEFFAQIDFNGGCGNRDSVVIVSSDNSDDNFSIDRRTENVAVPVYTTNPYAKTIECYDNLATKAYENGNLTLGDRYAELKATYEAKWETLSQMVRTSAVNFNTVSLFNDIQAVTQTGAVVTIRQIDGVLRFNGVRNVSIDAGDGNDRFEVVQLGTNYTLTGGAGVDTLDFSRATRTVTFDLGRLNVRQTPICGDAGTITLTEQVENYVGSNQRDVVTAGSLTQNITDEGGVNLVTLASGGVTQVALTGNSQTVVARGAGLYQINLTNGNFSTINAAGLARNGALNLVGNGNNVTLCGGSGTIVVGTNAPTPFTGNNFTLNGTATTGVWAFVAGNNAHIYTGGGADTVGVIGNFAVVTTNGGADTVAVTGNSAVINTNGGDDAVTVTGNSAVINTNDGADTVIVNGDSAVINTHNGDDIVNVTGGAAVVNLGNGNDAAVITDSGVAGRIVGRNYVYGGLGNDLINLSGASGRNYLYANDGNDVVIGSAGDDYIYGNSGRSLLVGLGGVDRIYGTSQADVLVANNLIPVGTLDQIYASWTAADFDVNATLALLGAAVNDGSRDWLYTYLRSNDWVEANRTLDNDFVCGLTNYADGWNFMG